MNSTKGKYKKTTLIHITLELLKIIIKKIHDVA